VVGIPPLSIGRALKAQRVKLPKALSVGEETLARDLTARRINFTREYEFCPGRKWRFDFVIFDVPKLDGASLAIEVEGGTHSRGRHTRASGFAADIEKYNTAALMGWVVLRYTTTMVKSGAVGEKVAQLMGMT
jgi:very-short-patch-repair endonuclease